MMMKPDALQQLFEEAIANALAKNKLLQKSMEKTAGKIKTIVPPVVNKATDVIYKTLKKNAPAMRKGLKAWGQT